MPSKAGIKSTIISGQLSYSGKWDYGGGEGRLRVEFERMRPEGSVSESLIREGLNISYYLLDQLHVVTN